MNDDNYLYAPLTNQVEDLVLSTLAQAAETGFEEEAIKASINSVEFALREFNTGSFPRGLSMMLGKCVMTKLEV